jgi:hypothetical protein
MKLETKSPYGVIYFMLSNVLYRQKRYAQAQFNLYIACRSNIEKWQYSETDIRESTGLDWKTVKANCNAFLQAGIFIPDGKTPKGSPKYLLIRSRFKAYMQSDMPLDPIPKRAAEGFALEPDHSKNDNLPWNQTVGSYGTRPEPDMEPDHTNKEDINKKQSRVGDACLNHLNQPIQTTTNVEGCSAFQETILDHQIRGEWSEDYVKDVLSFRQYQLWQGLRNQHLEDSKRLQGVTRWKRFEEYCDSCQSTDRYKELAAIEEEDVRELTVSEKYECFAERLKTINENGSFDYLGGARKYRYKLLITKSGLHAAKQYFEANPDSRVDWLIEVLSQCCDVHIHEKAPERGDYCEYFHAWKGGADLMFFFNNLDKIVACKRINASLRTTADRREAGLLKNN